MGPFGSVGKRENAKEYRTKSAIRFQVELFVANDTIEEVPHGRGLLILDRGNLMLEFSENGTRLRRPGEVMVRTFHQICFPQAKR
jgi:hypothetical protein